MSSQQCCSIFLILVFLIAAVYSSPIMPGNIHTNSVQLDRRNENPQGEDWKAKLLSAFCRIGLFCTREDVAIIQALNTGDIRRFHDRTRSGKRANVHQGPRYSTYVFTNISKKFASKSDASNSIAW
ncbi:uncharacterized protein LOC102803781 [Saccoglossus kowalevskii]|uniref:Uncharacterized protein LOC102803781 n=1 Tax=Saccoglossus kowalevskii TaxID=10224 RepID=A0ABM0MSX6_SACKO|nr:PREDICTED: uncharacterized protein LOC102803781 [Saccoglossus kowalevskii]